MSVERAKDVYNAYIRPLPVIERLRLLAMLAEDVAHQTAEESTDDMHCIMELHGLGKEYWKDIDPQQYVSDLRAEWDGDNERQSS